MIVVAARLLEIAGIRRWYARMARTSGEQVLPPVGRAREVDGSLHKLLKIRQAARYYLLSNLLRIGLLLPMLVGLWCAPMVWLVAFFSALVGFHLLNVALDAYKILVALQVMRVCGDREEAAERADDPQEELPPALPRHRWFDLRPFETERFFRLTGVVWFRRLVLEYVGRTQLTAHERASGERPFFLTDPNRANAIRYEHTTRVNEGMHLAAAATNLPPLVGFLWAQVEWAAAWATVVLLFDLYLSLLQRYLRWRVQGLVRRVRSRSEEVKS